jgi:hypothetical protein
MIFTESTIKISNNVSKMDSTIVLYRGDKNVEIRFTILQSPFKYSNTVATNVIESTNASYGQLVIKTPNNKPPIFSEVSATKDGTVLFTITKEMIDEIEELGVYTFQIRLMDENKQSRVTIPPIENGIEIKEPIAIEDDNTTNVVGLAKANYAVATLSDADIPTFDDNGKYNKTNWNDGDIITNVSLNKIEDGIYTTNTNVPRINSETVLVNITVDQLNKAWAEAKTNPDDTTMYIELPNFTIKDDALYFIEVNNKRYRLGSVYTEDITEHNKTRITLEFYNIADTTNNISGGEISTYHNKDCEYSENTAVVQMDRIDDAKPPIFTSGITLFEVSVNKFNTLLLGKNVDIYNSLSMQRDPNTKIGEFSTAMGMMVEASGFCSHAEGEFTVASASNSHAEGSGTTASGYQSHAEGSSTLASNFNSHAEGGSTKATGFCSHAEGSTTTASGVSSHAEGDYTTASGASSHAEGYGSKASSQFQHVQGKYNIEDKDRKYAHIVGNGAGDAKRSNAHTLDWKGNGWYAGKLSQEGTPTDDKDLATKKYVDDNILLEQLPILRIDETNKRIYVNCNNMGTYKKYFVPNKYANVYGFSFIYTNEDSSETEIALIGGAMTRDDFILCARNTDTLFILILGGTDKYKYTKSTKTLEKGLYGYLKIGNTQEYTPTENYNPATKKYVDDNRIGYIKSETVGETIDTSTMINSFNNNSYIYESNNVTYLEMGKEYHVIVNGVRYRALCINNMPGNDQIYETIIVTGDGFSISIMNKMGYNTKYYTDNTKCAYEIKLSDELLAAPPTIQILKMDIEYIPTYLMPKDLEILNSISVNRIGDIGTGSAAIGYKNTASNDFTFAMGIQTTASAPGAHAEGGLTVANGSYSHAEGFKSASTGEYSHVEGIVCESSGQGSHAEGYYTVASGQRSHSEGCFTEAASQYQHVQGKYNVVDSNGVYAHIVGNGTGKNNRHNAYTLDWQGNAWYSGKVTAGAAPVEDMDLTTKKYVDDKVSNLPQFSFNDAGELVVTINGVSKTFVPKNV